MKSLRAVWEAEQVIELTPAQVKQLLLGESGIDHERVAQNLARKGLVQLTEKGGELTELGRIAAKAVQMEGIRETDSLELTVCGESINVCRKSISLMDRGLAEALHEALGNRSMSEVCRILLRVYGEEAQRVIEYLE
jgi:Mn-dependent DtxR family transcriptional regulator